MKPARGELTSLIWANVLASIGFALIIVISGQYGNPLFWLASLLAIGMAYLIALVSRKFWRYALIVIGFCIPGIVGQFFESDMGDISAASLVFLLAVFWLPFIRGMHSLRPIRPEPNL